MHASVLNNCSTIFLSILNYDIFFKFSCHGCKLHTDVFFNKSAYIYGNLLNEANAYISSSQEHYVKVTCRTLCQEHYVKVICRLNCKSSEYQEVISCSTVNSTPPDMAGLKLEYPETVVHQCIPCVHLLITQITQGKCPVVLAKCFSTKARCS